MRDPPLPVVQGPIQRPLSVIWAKCIGDLALVHRLEDEGRGVEHAEAELGDRRAVLDPHWHGRAQPEDGAISAVRDEQHIVPLHLDGAFRTSIIEARIAAHAEMNLAANRFGGADDLVDVAGLEHRHEITDLGDPLLREESREQNVGLGKVELAVADAHQVWRDLEAPTLLIIKECGEHRW